MNNWNFDSIDGKWKGGHMGVDRRAKFKIKKLKYHKEVEVFIKDKPNGKEIHKENFSELDYKNQDFDEIISQKKYEIWEKFGLLKNQYRQVTYKGTKCYEVKLNRGYSMIVDIKDIDRIKIYIWNINFQKNGKNYNIGRAHKGKKRQHLSKFILEKSDNYIYIVNYKDNNPSNLIRSNIEDSGCEQTLVTDKIKKKNKKIRIELDAKLIKLRAEYDRLYEKNGSFKLEILDDWHRKGYKIERYKIEKCGSHGKHIIQILDKTNNVKKTKEFPFKKENCRPVQDKVVRIVKSLYDKYPSLFNNRYRFVKFNNIKCVEIELNDNKFTLVDINKLHALKQYKWKSQQRKNLSRAICYIDNKTLYMHQLITENKWKLVDHIDGNSLNNLSYNLRDGSSGVNQKNMKLFITNTSGYNGICPDEIEKRWRFKWHENGEKLEARFPFGIWGSREDALNAAVAFKVKIDKKFNNNNGIRT